VIADHFAELNWGISKILIVQGDITEQDSDAIVNAANSSLLGGGGVDGAIHRKGGPKILKECREIRTRDWPDGLPRGKAVITGGGNLKAKHVIHTVGPIWQGGNKKEDEFLAECYRNCMLLATTEGLAGIAFPSISTGAYGYPIAKASKIALRTVKDFVEKEGRPSDVRFVLFSKQDLEVYEKTAADF
jgi:O-acetyl-ADP-ribose deacetylase (regulator of RNase III)